jgi:hypothetical protein
VEALPGSDEGGAAAAAGLRRELLGKLVEASVNGGEDGAERQIDEARGCGRAGHQS